MAGNRRNPHSELLVVMQMHQTATAMKEDLVLATRAVAREVQVHPYLEHLARFNCVKADSQTNLCSKVSVVVDNALLLGYKVNAWHAGGRVPLLYSIPGK